MSSDLERFEALVARAMTSADPVAVFSDAARDESLPEPLREALSATCSDGVELSALLIARLRFERLVQGSEVAGAWFERDPRAFTAAFKRYHSSVSPTVSFPSEEGRLFETWLEDSGTDPSVRF